MENQTQQKPIFIPRAVTTIEMLNIISDKLDYLITKLDQKK